MCKILDVILGLLMMSFHSCEKVYIRMFYICFHMHDLLCMFSYVVCFMYYFTVAPRDKCHTCKIKTRCK